MIPLPTQNPSKSAGPTARHKQPRHRVHAVVLCTFVLIASLVGPSIQTAGAAPGDTTVFYDDVIKGGLQNWSWATVDTASTAQVTQGSNSISVDYAGWDALYFGTSQPVTIPASGQLKFSMHGGGDNGGAVNVQVLDPGGVGGPGVTVNPVPGQWQNYSIDLVDLGQMTSIGGIWWQDGTGTDRSPIYIDDVTIVEGEPPPAQTGPNLVVDLGANSITRGVVDPSSGNTINHQVSFPHTISEGIYGQNFSTNSFREEVDVPVNRWGGNGTERYNHLNGSSNNAKDWFFTNSPGDVGGDDTFESENQADGTDTIMTVPMIGWVAKNREANCSYPTTDAFGAANNATPMDETTVHWLDSTIVCGNGLRNGEFIGAADPTITSVQADESFATAWVQELVATHGNAASGGVEMYALGNEPGLWHATHGDIRATPIGRSELINKNVSYATAIKNGDPTADVIGPVLWSGYSYYVTSEEIAAGQRPGANLKTFVDDYLSAMAAADNNAGRRLLDTLAVNFYDDRVYQGGTDALRLDATRSLWDPSYAPSDWWVIRDFTYGNGQAVIPRLKGLIGQNYPGTELAITEYSFGGQDTLAGALAQTDVLGIFGREGLDTATIWEPYAEWTGLTEQQWANRPIMWAFRMYRNYDGNGSQFGDQSLYASSTDEPTVSVYGARRTNDGKVTVMVVNKSMAPQTSNLSIAGLNGNAETYRYSGDNLSAISQLGASSFNGSATLTLPGRSATLLVIDPSGGGQPTPTPIPATPVPPTATPVPPTPTPAPPTPTPVPSVPTISSPSAGSTLGCGNVAITWNDTVGEYWVYAGSQVGNYRYYNSGSLGDTNNDTIRGLPTDGSTVHVRLWSRRAGGSWSWTDTTYTACSQQLSTITSPAAGTKLACGDVTISWTDQLDEYWVYAGSREGSYNYYNSKSLGDTSSDTMTGLPSDGSQVYVRLWSRATEGRWTWTDTIYTACG